MKGHFIPIADMVMIREAVNAQSDFRSKHPEVDCIARDQQAVLFLPTDNAKIVVAAQNYEQVLREMDLQ